MIYDCPTCTAALRFNPTLNKLECLSCGNKYDVNEFKNKEGKDDISTYTAEENGETMECNIYSCTACGAELAVNGVESSTFCAYCGQPTVVFSRVSSELKPKYIIPFSVTKEQAVEKIRSRFKKGFFIPREIKNFEVERIRGIYIPYYIFDIDYSDNQLYRSKPSDDDDKYYYYYYREAESKFYGLALDASKQLNNETSQRLEPYDLSLTKFFTPGYLSGFYAYCCDDDPEDVKYRACCRAKEMFNAEVKKTVNASDIELVESFPRQKVTRTEYALFPAWFITFRYENTPYTIAVNGQTGKVIGGVPFVKKKALIPAIILSIPFSYIAANIVYHILCSIDDFGDGLETIIVSLIALFSWTIPYDKLEKSIKLSTLTATNDYVKDRQEGI